MKNVLLIAGGGTLGSYTSLELLRTGCAVDVIALEDLRSYNRNLRYIRERVSDELLLRLFQEKRYDGIVDFIHYPDIEQWKARFDLLASHTDRYVFLSSYRVYADEEHPLRESSPQLLDVFGESGLLAQDTYGIQKSYAERHILASKYKNWTIVRPLISFSHFRLDLVTLSGSHLLPRALAHKKVPLPEGARKQTAGLGWAGNVGKLIARLLFAPKACCEDFIVGNDENLTWEEIAAVYTEVMGLSFIWVDDAEYLKACTGNSYSDQIILYYDRLYNRLVDTSKAREAVGMKKDEFVGFRDALIYELSQLGADAVPRFIENEASRGINSRMDAWLETHGGVYAGAE